MVLMKRSMCRDSKTILGVSWDAQVRSVEELQGTLVSRWWLELCLCCLKLLFCLVVVRSLLLTSLGLVMPLCSCLAHIGC